MNKAQRCVLHLRCIGLKVLRGQRCGWHWSHIAREFGLGALVHEADQAITHLPHVVSRKSQSLA